MHHKPAKCKSAGEGKMALDKRELKKLIKIAKKPPKDPSECIKLGDQLTKFREWKAAINCYNSALSKDPENLDLLMKAAYVNACAGNLILTIKIYKTCLKLQPDNLSLLKNIATMCNAVGNPEQAIKYASKALKVEDNDPNTYYLLAESYTTLNEIQKAEPHYNRAIQLFKNTKTDSHTLIKMGRSLRLVSLYNEAIYYLSEACKLTPNLPGAQLELAQTYQAISKTDLAIKHYRRTLELSPKHSEALSHYAELMALENRLDKSAWAYRRLTKIFPKDSSFRHLLSASSQENIKGTTDEEYVKDVFDSYADSFEDHLVNALSYTIPNQLYDLYKIHWTGKKLNIMDLGCGTGLCGPIFKDIANHITGVDLSQGMLNEAQKKDAYNKLVLAELTSALKEEYHSQDLLIAADVFIYVGEIDSVFSAAIQALKPEGQFIFSVESLRGDHFKLGVSGRYQHSEKYIVALSKKHNLSIQEQIPVIIRTELDQAVNGAIYILKKS